MVALEIRVPSFEIHVPNIFWGLRSGLEHEPKFKVGPLDPYHFFFSVFEFGPSWYPRTCFYP